MACATFWHVSAGAKVAVKLPLRDHLDSKPGGKAFGT